MSHGRWEGPLDLFNRTLEQYKETIRKEIGEKFKSLVFALEDPALNIVAAIAYPENAVEGTVMDRKAAEVVVVDVPGLVVTPLAGFPVGVDLGADVGNTKHVRYSIQHRETPLLVEWPQEHLRFLVLQARTDFPDGDSRTFKMVIFDAVESPSKFFTLHRALSAVQRKISRMGRVIEVYGGNNIPLPETSWSDWSEVFLSAENKRKIKDDLEFFLAKKEVFREVGIPWKRGYLLAGPPGNGKTSVCRTIATSMPFAAYMFNFSNKNLHNASLTEAFERAVENAPAVFFLEDIDRVYDKDNVKEGSNITLDHLLNTLDGIVVNDGLVVIATANNYKTLDPAILSRPGRFDRVVYVDNPDVELRDRYVRYLFRKAQPQISEETVTWVVTETAGLSMAFLKEIFVASAQSAITSGKGFTHEVVVEAAEEILKMYRKHSRANSHKSGFGAD